jgi:hypothetical protein
MSGIVDPIENLGTTRRVMANGHRHPDCTLRCAMARFRLAIVESGGRSNVRRYGQIFESHRPSAGRRTLEFEPGFLLRSSAPIPWKEGKMLQLIASSDGTLIAKWIAV